MKSFIILSLLATMGFGYQYTRTPLGDSVDWASMRMLKESFDAAEDKNIIASPLGVLTLLSMFSAGTEGESRQEIMQLLNTTNYKQIEESYSELMSRFSSMDPNFLVLANKIYVSDKYTLNDQFSDVASQSYKSEVERVDFAQTKNTADRINQWASQKTKGHIDSPVNENTISPATALAMFNVIFFQGHWHIPFEASETKVREFYVDESKTVEKPMMRMQESLQYYEDPEIGARMLELPYKEEGFRMVVALPNKKDGLPEVVEKLSQRGFLEDVFRLSPTATINLEMPKFEIRNNLNLNEILPKVGVSRIFTEGATGVVRETAVAVSEAFQEAFVKVDEEGATAGAFTGFVMRPMMSLYNPPPPIEYKMDHPFLFAILHEDIILFTGTYTH